MTREKKQTARESRGKPGSFHIPRVEILLIPISRVLPWVFGFWTDDESAEGYAPKLSNGAILTRDTWHSGGRLGGPAGAATDRTDSADDGGQNVNKLNKLNYTTAAGGNFSWGEKGGKR